MFDNSYLSNSKLLVKIMKKSVVLDDQDELELYEITLLKSQNEELELELEAKKHLEEKKEQYEKNLLSILGRTEPIGDEEKIHKSSCLKALDVTYGDPASLIQPSHKFLKYSLVKNRESHFPVKNIGYGPLDTLLRMVEIRNYEIIREYTSENTKKAFNSDITYWQAWLSAIGFSFDEPISEDLLRAFIIQHVEGMDPTIDHKLVDQGYKYELGPHHLTTVKRRLASLSVCLELDLLPNPCRNKEIRILLGRLSKKYGMKKRKLAITKEILDDFLEYSDSSLIGIRDRAILLFGWASGGRRRSEIVDAVMENLSETKDGDFVYTIPTSKTDQESKGQDVPIKGRAAKALKDWLTEAGVNNSYIFRPISKGGALQERPLSPIDVNRIVKKLAKRAGYDPDKYGAHSLRSGFVTEGGRRGKPLGDIMAMTGHRNVATAMQYYQSGAILNNSAANLAD